MPKLKLTQVAVERLKPPATGRVEYWDSQLPGFGVRLAAARSGQGGRKTWQAMYRVNGKLVRETIGTLASIPKIEKARELARTSMELAQSGQHPPQERRRAALDRQRQAEATVARERDTLGAAIDRYLERYAVQRMRPAYFKETKRTLERDVKPALGSRHIGDIARKDIRELLEQVVDRGSPSHANHVLAYLRAMLGWAVSADLIASNPTDGLKMPAPRVERDRVLTDNEIRLFWSGCDKIGWPFGALFQLLLLTAQRRDELAEARWPEFDLDAAVWSLPRERTKNDKAHVVHLSPLAIEIIGALPQIGRENFVFTTTGETPVSGFGRARERLAAAMLDQHKAELRADAELIKDPAERAVRLQEIERATIAKFTLHDLRRTAATGMAGLRIAPHVVDRVLNHVAGRISGVARIYNRAEYLDERKAALNVWGRRVEFLLRSPLSNVVPMLPGIR